ncbi:MAG TPA: hypothetical protein VGD67_09930, partial [Pseudonocardiaceae bacterium]
MAARLLPRVRRRLLLVVDDVHELPPDSGAVTVLRELAGHTVDRLQLVLLSRRPLPFSLARDRGRGRLTELHAPELALGALEVDALLDAALPNGDPALGALVREHADGWPAAVRIVVEALRSVDGRDAAAVLDRLGRPGGPLYEYLAEEVVDQEPAPVRELLRWLALLGDADPASLAGTIDAGAPALLPDLVRRGLVREGPGRDRWSLVRPLREHFAQDDVLPARRRAALHGMIAAR